MDLIQSMDISASGMKAQRTRLNVISMNLANANTTRTEDGSPYRRKTSLFQTVPVADTFAAKLQDSLDEKIYGIKVSDIVPVEGEFKKVFDPSHPDADESGFVFMPNVNLVQEMVQMLNANRSYEANVTAVKTAKDMAMRALEIGK